MRGGRGETTRRAMDEGREREIEREWRERTNKNKKGEGRKINEKPDLRRKKNQEQDQGGSCSPNTPLHIQNRQSYILPSCW